MVVVSAGHVGGSYIVSSAADVLWMSVVHGMRGVCEMCMYLARGGMGGEGDEWMGGLGLGCGGVGGYGAWTGGLGWCYVCVSYESGLSV